MKSFVCQYGKRIRPKYFQNSRMVLSSLWNDDKICEKKLPVIFPFNVSQSNIVLFMFFLRKSRCNFGKVFVILSVAPTAFCSVEQSYSVLRKPKTNHGAGSPQSSGTIMYWMYTTQKMNFSIKNFISKCDQIRILLRIWSHLLKKSLTENFIFCAVVLMLTE